MLKYNSKWKNRRLAHGLFLPGLFLALEILFYSLMVYLVSQFQIFLLTLAVALIAIYSFITSSLVRFSYVCYRQKFQNEDNTLMSH